MKASKRVRRTSEHEPRQIEFLLFTKYVGDLKENESSNKNREMLRIMWLANKKAKSYFATWNGFEKTVLTEWQVSRDGKVKENCTSAVCDFQHPGWQAGRAGATSGRISTADTVPSNVSAGARRPVAQRANHKQKLLSLLWHLHVAEQKSYWLQSHAERNQFGCCSHAFHQLEVSSSRETMYGSKPTMLQSDTFTFTDTSPRTTIVTLLHHVMRKVTFQSKRGHSRVLRTGCLHQNICRTTSPLCWSWVWRSPGSGGKQRQDVTRHTSWVTGNSYKHSAECLIIHITLANYNTWL